MYESFTSLAAKQQEGLDFSIVARLGPDPDLAILAIHGGGIEPGTSALALSIGQSDWSLYLFEGLKPVGNGVLHLSSLVFDEPRGLTIVQRSQTVISVHGAIGEDEFIMVGGADDDLGLQVIGNLRQAGFKIRPSAARFRDRDGANICNRGRRRAGLQLEISRPLRDRCREDPAALADLSLAVREALRDHLQTIAAAPAPVLVM